MKNNYWIRSGSYSMAQRVLAFLFGFGSYFFLVRYFDVDSFGVWTLYVIISSSLEMARSSFVQNAFVKFFNDPSHDRSVLFWSSAFLNAAITLLIVCGLVLTIPLMSSFWKTDLIGEIVYWYCLTSIVLIPFTQFNYLEQANHRFKGVFWSSAARQGLFFLIVVIVFFFFPGLPMRFFAIMHVISACVGLAVSYYQTHDIVPNWRLPDWALVTKLFRFGKYILGTGLTSAVGKNTDQVILGSVNHAFVALYNAGVRVLNFIEIPTLSISNIVYPKAAQAAAENGNQGVGRMYQKSVGTILAFVLPIIIVALIIPEFVLLVTAGAKYTSAAPVLRIMVVASLLLPFNVQMGSSFEVLGKPQIGFYINLFANIYNVVCNILLIPLFGVIGAACAFASTLLIIFIGSQVMLRRYMQVSFYGIFQELWSVYIKGWELVIKLIKSKI